MSSICNLNHNNNKKILINIVYLMGCYFLHSTNNLIKKFYIYCIYKYLYNHYIYTYSYRNFDNLILIINFIHYITIFAYQITFYGRCDKHK